MSKGHELEPVDPFAPGRRCRHCGRDEVELLQAPSAECDGELVKVDEQVREPAEPLTLDQARSSLAASMIRALQATIVQEVHRVQSPGLDLVEVENGKLMCRAAAELILSLQHAAKQFDRPRILRPERRVRIIRGH
jgi:hypothetical protein